MRAIDADALKKNRLGYSVRIDSHTGRWPCVLLSEIGNAPTLDVEPVRHGRWMWDEANQGYYCPHCPTTFWKSPDVPDAFKRCPNCGAKMDLE